MLLGMCVILVRSITGEETSRLAEKQKGNSGISKFYKFASESSTSILYLIITILAITVGLMQVILQYYLTDG